MGADLRRVRRVAWVALVVVAGVVVVPAAFGARGATCAAADEIRVRVVVDFGDSSPSPVSDVCVPVADRTTGAELLAARARQLGTPAPRFENGFVCAIDGYPETGCGDRTADGYRYWSYWHGDSGRWTYANVGAAGWKLRDGDVEGWHFLTGGAEAQATPPRGDATPCPAVVASTTTTAPPRPTAPAAVTALPAGTTAPTAVPASSVAVTPTTAFGHSAGVSSGSVTESGERTAAAARRSGDGDNSDSGGNGPPVGLLVVAGAIVVLGTAAGLRFRRRGDG